MSILSPLSVVPAHFTSASLGTLRLVNSMTMHSFWTCLELINLSLSKSSEIES